MTSPIENITVRCPKCGHLYEDWLRRSLNVDLDPWVTDEYAQRAFTATCPECHHVVDLGGLVVRDNVWTVGTADDDAPAEGR